MKTLLLPFALFLSLAAVALAGAPSPMTDFNQTLSAAAKDQKLAFLLLGREACSICNATKAMIKEGKIRVTATNYVAGYLNVDDRKTHDEFMQRYGKEKFGNTLPFVVVTDSQGNLLASSGGYKDAAQWNALLTKARSKAAAEKSGAGNGSAGANWPSRATPTPTAQ